MRVFLCLLFCILSLFVYSPSIKGDFVVDDIQLIRQVDAGNKGFTDSISRIFSNYYSENYYFYYRPVSKLFSYATFLTFKYNPQGYHLSHIILHGFVAYLFYLIMTLRFKISGKTALPVSLIFLFHPVNIENIVLLGGITDIFYTLFGLLGLFIILGERKNEKIRISSLLYISIFYILALLSKESAIIFLPVYFIFSFKEKWSAKLIYILAAITLLYGTIYITFFGSGILMKTEFERWLPVLNYFYHFIYLFYPATASFFYAPPHTSLFNYPAPGILIAAIIAVLYFLRKDRENFILFSALILSLAPTLVLFYMVASHNCYLPLIFLLLFAGANIDKLKPDFKTKIISGLACVLILSFFLTMKNCKVWHSSETLYNYYKNKLPAKSQLFRQLLLEKMNGLDDRNKLKESENLIAAGYYDFFVFNAVILLNLGESNLENAVYFAELAKKQPFASMPELKASISLTEYEKRLSNYPSDKYQEILKKDRVNALFPLILIHLFLGDKENAEKYCNDALRNDIKNKYISENIYQILKYCKMYRKERQD